MRYVVAVAEERSFTRAAARTHVVQSALSHQIKALERELGVSLFARTSRRVEVTPAGEAFLVSARASLDAAERAASEALTAAQGRLRGSLSIGLIPTVTGIDIPAVLADFHGAHPDVGIRLHTGSSDDFVADIARGRMDVAVLGLPDARPPKGVSTRVLARERLVAVVSPEHALARRRRLRIEELADEVFVDFPAHTSGRAPSDIAFRAAGIHREVAFEATGSDLILGIVARGLAIALLSPAVVPAGDGFRTIPVVAGPTRIEYLAWSGFNPSPATRAFLRIPALAGEE